MKEKQIQNMYCHKDAMNVKILDEKIWMMNDPRYPYPQTIYPPSALLMNMTATKRPPM